MLSLWRQLIVPRAADSTLRRRETLLYVLTLTSIGAATFWILVTLVFILTMGPHRRLIGDLIVGLETLVFSGLAYLIARRGAVLSATYIAISGLVVMQISSMLLIWQTPMDPSLVFYALAIALGGLLLGRKGAIFFYACSLLSYVIVSFWLYYNGYRSAEITHIASLLIIAFMLALILGILLLVVHYYIRSLEQSLEQAEEVVQVRTTELLHEFQQREAILHSVADGVVVADRQQCLLLFNPVAARVIPCLKEMGLGRPLAEFGLSMDPEDPRRDVLAHMAEFLTLPDDAGAVTPIPQMRFTVGSQTWVALYAPVVGTEGEIEGVVTILHDITQEIEAINARTQFVSAVAHDLRAPLTSIRGYSDLLLIESADDLEEQQLSYLRTILRNAERMANLVQDLLDLCRLESGRVQMEIELISLREAILEVATLMQLQMKEKGIVLETHLPPDLPLVLADPHRLNQVLTNLASNAYRYTPTSGRITIGARVLPPPQSDLDRCPEEDHTYVDVTVTDTGIGIAPGNLERIFDRFVRLDHPMVEQAEGTGLGLTIARQLLHLQGGRIWVESRLGEGSTFHFTLPVPDRVR